MQVITNKIPKLISLCIGIGLLSFKVLGQNMLPNAGFVDINICCEKNAACSPEGWFGYSLLNYEPNFMALNPELRKKHNTPNCLWMEAGGPENFADYANYCAFSPLLSSLKAGYTYNFSVYVQARTYALNQIHVLLSDTVFPDIKNIAPSITLQPTFKRYIKTGKNGWIQLTGKYQANGSEKYLFFGMLKPCNKIKYKRLGGARGLAGFYADDIAFIPDSSNQTQASFDSVKQIIYSENRRHDYTHKCEGSGNIFPQLLIEQIKDSNTTLYGITRGEKLIEFNADMEDKNYIYFLSYLEDTALNIQSAHILHSLINQLKQNTKLKLQLKAHVDNSYQGLQNISAFEIGLMHAHAVKKYLIKQGIPKDQIRVLSEGTSKPIGNKNTSAGQLLNTRMEYEWFK